MKVEAQVIYTGRTSMHIAINVFSRNIKRKDFEKKTHCIIVFVAVDDEGNSVEVPKFLATTEQDQQMEQYAIKLMDLRKQIEDEMKPFM